MKQICPTDRSLIICMLLFVCCSCNLLGINRAITGQTENLSLPGTGLEFMACPKTKALKKLKKLISPSRHKRSLQWVAHGTGNFIDLKVDTYFKPSHRFVMVL